MRKLIYLAVCYVGFTVLPAFGESAARILSPEEVTEAGVIEMLAPERSIRTRSIRVFSNAPESTGVGNGTLSVMITFETNSAILTSEAMTALDTLGRALKMDRLADLKFAIEGHTDPRGSFSLNQSLSQARAETVKDYLVWKHQIDRDRLTAVGKGYSELADQSNPTAPENRRVTFVRVNN